MNRTTLKRKTPLKARPHEKNKSHTEEEIQEAVENKLKEMDLRYIHIPAGVYKMPKVAGIFKGVPDLMIFAPDQSSQFNLCLLLELKTEVGKLRQGQKKWHKNQNVLTAYGMSDAMRVLDDFFKYINKKG